MMALRIIFSHNIFTMQKDKIKFDTQRAQNNILNIAKNCNYIEMTDAGRCFMILCESRKCTTTVFYMNVAHLRPIYFYFAHIKLF